MSTAYRLSEVSQAYICRLIKQELTSPAVCVEVLEYAVVTLEGKGPPRVDRAEEFQTFA